MQIAEQIMDGIESGEWPPGERLPSVRETAGKVMVNPNTVMRTYDWLQQNGIIFNKRGIGFFVADNGKELITERRREDFFNNEMEHFLKRLRAFGVTPDQLKAEYEKYLKG